MIQYFFLIESLIIKTISSKIKYINRTLQNHLSAQTDQSSSLPGLTISENSLHNAKHKESVSNKKMKKNNQKIKF